MVWTYMINKNAEKNPECYKAEFYRSVCNVWIKINVFENKDEVNNEHLLPWKALSNKSQISYASTSFLLTVHEHTFIKICFVK